jgi:hypothetical protein
MLRPKITIEMLSLNEKLFYGAIQSVAKPEDFKTIFTAQAFGGTYSLRNAVAELYKKNEALNKSILDFVNDDLRYSPFMTQLIANKQHFENTVIPTREADFMLSDVGVGQDVYFWIEERIEITLEIKTNRPHVAKLMVDDKSDALLFNNGQDSWIEYGSGTKKHHKAMEKEQTLMDFGDKVAIKYKEFLAEQQLLKD